MLQSVLFNNDSVASVSEEPKKIFANIAVPEKYHDYCFVWVSIFKTVFI